MKRQRLPVTRKSITHKIIIYGEEKFQAYMTIGLFDNGQPGELFFKIDKDRSKDNGMLNSWAIAISMLLQSGWTVEDLYKKFCFIRHEPAGFTDNTEIPNCLSVEDYVMRFMEKKFVKEEKKDDNKVQVVQKTNPIRSYGLR